MKKATALGISFFSAILLFAAELNLTSPRGGERWTLGQSQTITWTSTGIAGEVKLVLWQQGRRVGVITEGTLIDPGSFTWEVGTLEGGQAVPGSGYRISIQTPDGSYQDWSRDSFTISESRAHPAGQAATRPTITVASPNGRESLKIGEMLTIEWSASEVTEDVSIALSKRGSDLGLIAEGLPAGQGTFEWHVGDPLLGGQTYGPGTDFRIVVMARSGQPRDQSNADFSIVSAQIRPARSGASARPREQTSTIQILSPNGGEILYSGDPITIRYQTSGSVDRVTTWLQQLTPVSFQRSINTNASNTGQFDWSIPNIGEKGDFKVKIYGHVSGDTWVEDESNGPFSIYKGFDVRPILKKLDLKVNYHGAQAKDYVVSLLDPKEYVRTLVESYKIESLDFRVEFEIENTGHFHPQEAVSVPWQIIVYRGKELSQFMTRSGAVSMGFGQGVQKVSQVLRLGGDVLGLLKFEISVDPGGVSPESDLFTKDNTVSRSLVLKVS